MTDTPSETQERVPLVPSKAQVWRNFFRHAATALGVLTVSGVVCGGLYEWVRPTDYTPFWVIKYSMESLLFDPALNSAPLFYLVVSCLVIMATSGLFMAFRYRHSLLPGRFFFVFLIAITLACILAFLSAALGSMKQRKFTQLHLAASYGWDSRAKILIWLDWDINTKDIEGHFPLNCAIMYRHAETARLLIKHGGKRNGNLCYVLALSSNEPSALPIAELFIEQIGNVDHVFPVGHYTALHLAAVMSNSTLAEYLLNNGADIEARSEQDKTPLHKAVDHDETDRFSGGPCVNLLLDHGADVNAIDSQGRTPLDIARYDELKQLLRDRGGLTGQELTEIRNQEAMGK